MTEEQEEKEFKERGFFIRNEKDSRFLVTKGQTGFQEYDSEETRGTGCGPVAVSTFICSQCDDTHLQLSYQDKEGIYFMAILLPAEAAELLAKWLNAPST